MSRVRVLFWPTGERVTLAGWLATAVFQTHPLVALVSISSRTAERARKEDWGSTRGMGLSDHCLPPHAGVVHTSDCSSPSWAPAVFCLPPLPHTVCREVFLYAPRPTGGEPGRLILDAFCCCEPSSLGRRREGGQHASQNGIQNGMR